MESGQGAVEMIQKMRVMERRFDRVCRQLILMKNNIRAINARYQRALLDDRKTLRYNLRLRILTLEGVRDMFTQYAEDKADQLDAMEDELLDKYDIDWQDVCDADLLQG